MIRLLASLLTFLPLGYTPALNRPIVRLDATPATVWLDGRESRQQVVVTGYRADGTAADLTGMAYLDPQKLVRAESMVLRPRQAGTGRVVVRAANLSTAISVHVLHPNRPCEWTFENHVESVFSKQGCNTGPCHGAGSGKGGLKLSLRAYDPASDFLRLRTEGLGRRLNRVRPSESLILQKPSLAAAHVGGLRLRRDTLEYRVIRDWIAAGASGPRPSTPHLTTLSVFPSDRTLEPNATQRLLVRARFSDGHSEDVTHWSRFSSNEEPIANVDESGLVTMRGRGETAVTVWYLGKVAFARVRVPFGSGFAANVGGGAKPDRLTNGELRETALRAARTAASGPSPPGYGTTIDRLVDAKLAQLDLRPSPPCSDSEFIRRAFLDAIGALPTPDETLRFVSDTAADKRNQLIDSLLSRPEFVDFWTYRWADLLRVNRDLVGQRGASVMHAWLRECVARNVGWDRMAYDLVIAAGGADSDGPASFYRMGAKPEEFAETVSQAFLGVRIQCAHCHNHPFEKWTQADYFRMANIFARVGRKTVRGVEIVFARPSGDVAHPRFGRPLTPAPLDGPSIPLESTEDRRLALAKWMTAPDNPYFPRAIVNRVWKQFMGRGLVEPVDDMRLTNPASNDPLFQAVCMDFVASGFDLRHLMRDIMRSRAYQRSAATTAANAADDRFYSHYLPRRMAAETLLDAVCQATGVPEKFAGIPSGARAVSLPDTKIDSAFLDAFGRPARQVTCECERNMDPNMSQALHLINAQTLNAKIAARNGPIQQLVDSGRTDDAVLEELYLRCLSRRPASAERAAFRRALASADAKLDLSARRRQVFTDLFWALLSGPEFVFNH